MTRIERVREHYLNSASVVREMEKQCADVIIEIALSVARSLRDGGKLMLCGNGGSAADCQHLAAEFTNRLRSEVERRPLPALALTTDTSFLTACSNDYEYERVFTRQLEALGREGDLLLGISTSGNSENVLRAVNRAQETGVDTAAFTGASGGALAEVAEMCLCVPSENTQFIQQGHITAGHIMVELVEATLFEE